MNTCLFQGQSPFSWSESGFKHPEHVPVDRFTFSPSQIIWNQTFGKPFRIEVFFRDCPFCIFNTFYNFQEPDYSFGKNLQPWCLLLVINCLQPLDTFNECFINVTINLQPIWKEWHRIYIEITKKQDIASLAYSCISFLPPCVSHRGM